MAADWQVCLMHVDAEAKMPEPILSLIGGMFVGDPAFRASSDALASVSEPEIDLSHP